MTKEKEIKIIGRCMKCKKQQEMKNMEKVTMKNGRLAAKGKCVICETNMFKILNKEGK
jgi:hypothetical protein